MAARGGMCGVNGSMGGHCKVFGYCWVQKNAIKTAERSYISLKQLQKFVLHCVLSKPKTAGVAKFFLSMNFLSALDAHELTV